MLLVDFCERAWASGPTDSPSTPGSDQDGDVAWPPPPVAPPHGWRWPCACRRARLNSCLERQLLLAVNAALVKATIALGRHERMPGRRIQHGQRWIPDNQMLETSRHLAPELLRQMGCPAAVAMQLEFQVHAQGPMTRIERLEFGHLRTQEGEDILSGRRGDRATR